MGLGLDELLQVAQFELVVGPLLEPLWKHRFAKLDVVETHLCEFDGVLFRDSLEDLLH